MQYRFGFNRGVWATASVLLLGVSGGGALAFAGLGCSGTQNGAPDSLAVGASTIAPDAGVDAADAAPTVALAERLFRDLEPDLKQHCGGACHEESLTENAPPWLKAPDYDTIRAYPGIVIHDVYSSKILVKTNHLGISLTDASLSALRDKVVTWLTAEAEAAAQVGVPETSAFPVTEGVNAVDLSLLAKDITGARLTFNATIHAVDQSQILQLTNVQIQAPSAAPLHVLHPVLVIVPSDATALATKDPTDQFSTVDQTIPAATSAALGPGSAMLVRFPVGAQLKIQFDKIEAVAAAAAAKSCKNVAAYSANAVVAIQANGCLGCHGGPDAAAVAALDMTKVGTDDGAACVQALSKVNFADKSQSPIILAPTMGNSLPHQGGKNLDPASDFVTKMKAWIQGE